MPPESRDGPEDLPKERRCQVAFGELEEDNGLRVARKLRRPAERAAGRINGGEDGAVRAGGGG